MQPKASTDLETIRRFQSEVASIREAPEPYAVRMTVHVLAAAIVLAVVVSLFAKVDRIVSSSSGKIVATVKPTVFQALDDNSIIKSIDVREGDRVVKGQVLVTIDPTFAGADVRQLLDQIGGLDAEIARARGEQQGRAPSFPQADTPSARQYVALQQTLYEQRSANYKAQLASFDQKINQTLATIKKSQDDQTQFAHRDRIAKQIASMNGVLLDKGAGTLLNKLNSEDVSTEMARQLEFARNSEKEAGHQLNSLRSDREAFIQNWQTSISQEIVTAQGTRDAAAAQLDKAKKHKELVQIVAPDDAIVLQVTKLSVGSVLKSADQLITLTPLAAPVEAQINLAARDIGFIRVGDRTTIKVDAFSYAHHGVAAGSVAWISEGAFVLDEDTGQPVQPYYRVRVRIDEMNFVGVPENFRLIPGMTLTGDIDVGRRTIASYVWEILVRGFGEAMREP
jgi:HlyD family secretion protein